MMHPDTQLKFVSSEIGFGVFALNRIPKGTITYALDDLELVISESQYQLMDKIRKQKIDWFSYRDENNNRIVSWDHAKYVNHCCNANTLTTGWGFEIAVRDIEAGEEITDDYGLFLGPEESMVLKCSGENCRGIVCYNDRYTCGAEWDRKIMEAVAIMNLVEQPLMQFIPDDTRTEILAYSGGSGHYRSVSRLSF